MVLLENIQLIPVVELVPWKFATQSRKSPSGTVRQLPEEWGDFWSQALADSGITELQPLRPGSFHVPTSNFDSPEILQRYLEITFRDWGGIDTLSDPDCNPVLDGGLALRCPTVDLLIEPACCGDLRNINDWKAAATYRGTEWQMLWIGHPWLSVRYDAPRLILSEPHESTEPCARWAILPAELDRAIVKAQSELERFAGGVARLLPAINYQGDSAAMALRLAGMYEEGSQADNEAPQPG